MSKFDSNTLGTYWSTLSERTFKKKVDNDALFASICYARMPLSFNNMINHFQIRAVNELLKSIPKDQINHGLDIGCGIGRWTRYLSDYFEASFLGIDIDTHRIEQAQSLTISDKVTFRTRELPSIEQEASSLDFVNSITVLQHVPPNVQTESIKNISESLRPGGYALIMELIDQHDKASHVFPRTTENWISLFEEHGLKRIKIVGNEYILPFRLLKRLSQSKPDSQYKPLSNLQLKVIDLLSYVNYPIEYAAKEIINHKHARLNGFLLRKG